MRRLLLRFPFAAVVAAAPAIFGQPAPSLGTAENFVILAGTRVTSSGPTRVTGRIGVSSGASITGFPPGILALGADAIETNERTVRRAQQDNAAVHASNTPAGGDIRLAGEILVDEGIVRIGGDLVVAPGTKMTLKDGALSSRVFWIVGGSVTLGDDSAVAGNFLARNDIAFGHGVTLAGRVLSQNGAVTLDADAVNLCGKLVTLSPPPLPSGTVNSEYPKTTITADGGDAPYKLEMVDGSLPRGLSFDGGVLSGTPAESGRFVFGVTAIDAKGAVGIRYYTIDVCPNLTLPPALPPANVCDPYNARFEASGGSGPYTYKFTGLPPGLESVSPFITGTPAKAGNFPVEACATDTPSGCSVCALYTLPVGCNVTITASLPNGTECQPYNGRVTASCGGVVTLVAGALPPGVGGLAPDGVISGTPTTPGKYTFTVRVDHESGCSVTGTYTVEIAPAAALTPIELFGTVCSAVDYNLGGTITGSLPKGLHGALQGVPRETGTFPFTVTSSDPNACPRQRDYTITIACPKTILLPTLPNEWRFYTPLSIAIVRPDLASCFTYSVNAATLPPNTFFDVETRTLKGLPDALGIFNVEVTAKDSVSGCEVTQIYPLEIFDPPLFCEPLIVASPLFGTLSSGTAGTAYPAQAFTAAGGIPPYTYDVVIATLPPGLSLSSSGVLTGTPSTPGRFIFAVNATDSTGTPGCPQVYSIDIGN
ncbi:MAG TPA: putative Ig domain-containing protein [Thermoanaerobaculia bacterium]|jgi:hypothetical protein